VEKFDFPIPLHQSGLALAYVIYDRGLDQGAFHHQSRLSRSQVSIGRVSSASDLARVWIFFIARVSLWTPHRKIKVIRKDKSLSQARYPHLRISPELKSLLSIDNVPLSLKLELETGPATEKLLSCTLVQRHKSRALSRNPVHPIL
jgi:hypothetical protein